MQERSDGLIHGGQEPVFEVGEGIAVGIPGFIVAEIDLDEWDPAFDEFSGEEKGPAEGVISVAFTILGGGGADVEGLADGGIDEEVDGAGMGLIELVGGGGGVELAALAVDLIEPGDPLGEAAGSETFREREAWRFECEPARRVGTLLMVEFESGIRAVAGRIEGGDFEEPGVSAGAQGTGELAGDDATGVVDQAFGQDDRGGEVVASWGE